MKILIVSDYSNLSGGIEVMQSVLRDGLRKRGHDARLFTSSAQTGDNNHLADYECFGTTSRFRTLLQTFNPSAFIKLRQVLKEFKPDIVHVNVFLTQLSPLILPLLKNVRSLLHVHWYRIICPIGTKMLPNGNSCHVPYGMVCHHNHCLPLRDWIPLMLQMKLYRHWLKVFDTIIANSEAVRNRIVTEGVNCTKVIWYGTPVSPARPPLVDPPTVVFAGRLSRQKGVDVLLEAFAKVTKQIPQAKLLVVGEGPEENNIKLLIRKLKISSPTSMLGFLERSQMEQIFQNAWIQVVPSRWEEPFGVVAIEAMMRGTAVIASCSGGLVEIIKNGETGILVPPGDINTLATALLRILKDQQLAETMGKNGRLVALENFSADIYIDKFIKLYISLMENELKK